MEPIFVNPCSCEVVTEIFREIGKTSGFPKYNDGHGHSMFIPVFCDGSPYNLCFRVILLTYECNHCSVKTCGLEAVQKHTL